MPKVGPAVVFDFDGSLNHAAHLWRTADELDQFAASRLQSALVALDGWIGPFAVEFAERSDVERRETHRLAESLRDEARAWATEWKNAMDQKNRNRWARRVNHVRSKRSTMDKVSGFFTGHDDLPPEPNPADTPVPPHFAPTRRFVWYGN